MISLYVFKVRAVTSHLHNMEHFVSVVLSTWQQLQDKPQIAVKCLQQKAIQEKNPWIPKTWLLISFPVRLYLPSFNGQPFVSALQPYNYSLLACLCPLIVKNRDGFLHLQKHFSSPIINHHSIIWPVLYLTCAIFGGVNHIFYYGKKKLAAAQSVVTTVWHYCKCINTSHTALIFLPTNACCFILNIKIVSAHEYDNLQELISLEAILSMKLFVTLVHRLIAFFN